MIKTTSNIEQVRYCRDKIENLVLRKSGEFTGEHNQWLFGMIAETIVCDELGQERPLVRNESDKGSDVTINGVKVDVKLVLRNKKPLMRYVAAVAVPQLNNNCDAYLFMSYNRKNGNYYLMGWIDKEDFIKQSTLINKGEPMPNDNIENAPIAEISVRVIPYNKLNKLFKWSDLNDIKKGDDK